VKRERDIDCAGWYTDSSSQCIGGHSSPGNVIPVQTHPMSPPTLFDTECRLATHLTCMFAALSDELIRQFPDELSWAGLSRNERRVWTHALLMEHRARWDEGIFANPSIVWNEALRSAWGEEEIPWNVLLNNPTLPLTDALLRQHEKTISWLHLGANETWTPALRKAWAHRMVTVPDFPPPREGPMLRPLSSDEIRDLEATHRLVSSAPRNMLERAYEDLCAAPLGANPDAFLARLFAKGPRYYVCEVELSDAHGVLPALEVRHIDAKQRTTLIDENAPLKVQCNPYAQGPARNVSVGGVQLELGHERPGFIIEREWKNVFSQLSLPPHRYLELDVAKSKKVRGDYVMLQFHQAFRPGAVLAMHYDLLGAYREPGNPMLTGVAQLVVSRRVLELFRAASVPHLRFTSAAFFLFELAKNVAMSPKEIPTVLPKTEKVQLTKEARFYTEKRERLVGVPTSLPASHVFSTDAIGRAEKRLVRIFPEGIGSFMKKHGKHPIASDYHLLAPSRFYLLNEHGYELEHPESWGAVAIGENGHGDCIGLLLRKTSDHTLGTTLYAFQHATGRIRRLPITL
jgi:hypothetical protein